MTGGGSGIGESTCAVLSEHGWDAIAADVHPPTDGIALDVTDETEWDRVLARTGPLAGLVCSAGIRTRSMIVDTTVEEFRRHLDVNVVGTWLGIRALLRHTGLRLGRKIPTSRGDGKSFVRCRARLGASGHGGRILPCRRWSAALLAARRERPARCHSMTTSQSIYADLTLPAAPSLKYFRNRAARTGSDQRAAFDRPATSRRFLPPRWRT